MRNPQIKRLHKKIKFPHLIEEKLLHSKFIRKLGLQCIKVTRFNLEKRNLREIPQKIYLNKSRFRIEYQAHQLINFKNVGLQTKNKMISQFQIASLLTKIPSLISRKIKTSTTLSKNVNWTLLKLGKAYQLLKK